MSGVSQPAHSTCDFVLCRLHSLPFVLLQTTAETGNPVTWKVLAGLVLLPLIGYLAYFVYKEATDRRDAQAAQAGSDVADIREELRAAQRDLNERIDLVKETASEDISAAEDEMRHLRSKLSDLERQHSTLKERVETTRDSLQKTRDVLSATEKELMRKMEDLQRDLSSKADRQEVTDQFERMWDKLDNIQQAVSRQQGAIRSDIRETIMEALADGEQP